ncbi:uncharacterized protein PV06_04473 [Exophiala oligosperma]|uniref:DUF7908 domain-containing protein n=1 Tax=Exophiala oligosperma TaxID=215243 RepID=A0A0D2C0Y0_9EURO|nr:uncharacterized protein PV06_04473 [Exophiala oligosperma]KIW43362.1 hypothetical protein PV06_04473 [Exophiala oligosperma]
MIWRLLTGVAFVANLAGLVTGYGTTVFVEVSYCPATYTTSTLATRTMSSAPSSTSSLTPIVLTVMQGFGEQPQYVSADGTMTNDSSLAVDFSINPTGQLEGAGGFISTDGNEASMTFEVSPTPGAISTFFSLVSNDTIARRDDTHASKILVWRNIAFFGGEATFCVFGSILEVVFGGTLPPGCHEVLLGAIPASDVQNPTSFSMTTVPPSSTSTDSAILTDTTTTTYSFVPTSHSPSLSPTREPTSASTTSQTSSLYLSPSSTRAESSATTSYSSTLTSTSSPTLSDYPAPTTTGIPNCYDRSPFDGTVNNDYLILCDTDLPGYDIQRVSASNIADCIDECNSYIPSSQGPCVAIAFDILAPANPCALKYNISDVFRGADSFSQAAILVNQPYSPEIVFAEPPTSSSSSTSEETSSTMPPPDSTSSPSSVATTPLPEFTTSLSSIPTTPPASPMTSGTGAAISTSAATQRPPSPTTTRTTQTSPSMTSSSHNSPATPASSSTTRTSTLPVPTSSPITSSTTSQQPATVATTTMGQQQSSNPPSTFRSPLSSSTSPSAVSSSTSMVVSSVISSTSASPTSPTTGPTFNAPSSSSGPISSTSSIVTTPSTSLAATSLFTTSSPRPITTTLLSSTTSTSATLSYCSATPITTSLCPAYDHQALNVNGDGSCYEVECSTTLQGNILTGNSTTASSLKTCTSFCTLYNVAVPFGCVGVNFLGSLSGNSPNCILMSSVSSTTFGGGIDSARLLYPGYPSINDPDYLGATTTTVAVSTIRSSSSSSATSLVGGSSSGSGGSQTGTSAGGTRTSATSTTSTTTLSPPSCPAAPTASSCPAPSGSPVPYCYNYTNYGNTAPFEVECSTSFTGATMQPLLAFSFEDCVSWCQYANILVPNSCVGMTYQYGTVSQGGSNNCVRYSTLTCASRGNATYGSARLIWSGHPAMTDYGGNFGC